MSAARLESTYLEGKIEFEWQNMNSVVEYVEACLKDIVTIDI